jgi:hypothetical protein
MASRHRCSRLGDVDIVAARGPRGDEDHRRRRSRPDPLSRHVGGINMGKWYSRLTDVVIKENGGASGVKVLETSKVVNLTINDYPLKWGCEIRDKFEWQLKREILTRSPSLLCFVTWSRVSFWSCLGSAMEIYGGRRRRKLCFIALLIKRTGYM